MKWFLGIGLIGFAWALAKKSQSAQAAGGSVSPGKFVPVGPGACAPGQILGADGYCYEAPWMGVWS